MTTREQPVWLVELDALLQLPDPHDMYGRRGSHVTVQGDPNRRQTVLLRLLIKWQQRRLGEVDWEPTVIVRTKRRLCAVS